MTPNAFSFWLLFAAVFCETALAQNPAIEINTALEFFEREVRPVLAEHCFECHGSKIQEAGLRLDLRTDALAGGESGPALVPGHPEQSRLIAAIEQRGDLKMPPRGRLSPAQIAAIEQWIQSGAVWPNESAMPSKNENTAKSHWAFQPLLDPVPPALTDSQIKTPEDSFWITKLQADGLIPSPPADRVSLIHRVTMDVTGLRPTPEAVAAFVNDTSPKAYEKLVDRLLNSSDYGEHWARHWLDVARYSDTKGYVYAREQRQWIHAWAYRDWVIRSLNEDLPYDRFLVLQIAADQAAPNDPAAQAAMGYLTLGRRFLGVARDIIDDRIDVVTRGTLGLTVSCARCHDHKYDPIPTKDYYALYGVFLNSFETQVPLVDDQEAGSYAKWNELKEKEEKRNALIKKRCDEISERVRARIGDYLQGQFELAKYPFEGFDQIIAKSDLLPLMVRRWEAYLASAKATLDPVFVPWHAYAQLGDEEFSLQAPRVTDALQKLDSGAVDPRVLSRFQTSPSSKSEMVARYTELFQSMIEELKDDSKDRDELESFRFLLMDVNGPCGVPNEPIVNTEYLFDSGTCDELWKLQNESDNLLLQSTETPPHAIVLKDRNVRTLPRVFRRGNPATPGDFVEPHSLSLLTKGDAPVFREGSGRLELAQSIVSPENPLTARVIVNRVWAHYFGNGLVRTPSDFGTRAEAPSHPELLDWLAQRFIDEGWSLKRLHRRMLLTTAYQQSSRGPIDAETYAQNDLKDPENRGLWRMPVKRVTFETLVDNIRVAAGTLEHSIGGRPAEYFADSNHRRSIYAKIDRQFLPNTLRVFDVANPDLHIPQRAETTVPQQSLFLMNHPWVLAQAKSIAQRSEATSDSRERILHLHRLALIPEPTDEQLETTLSWILSVPSQEPSVNSKPGAWSYGYGRWDNDTKRLMSFDPLPYFNGEVWQGSDAYPDAKLGWLQLSAQGGHPGNDLDHAVVRRWTAPQDLQIKIDSGLTHQPKQGDGVRGHLCFGTHEATRSETIHHGTVKIDVEKHDVRAGETVDFIVDIGGTLSYDQFLWKIAIEGLTPEGTLQKWNAESEFQGAPHAPLNPWEQLAHVLLMSNAFMFVD